MVDGVLVVLLIDLVHSASGLSHGVNVGLGAMSALSLDRRQEVLGLVSGGLLALLESDPSEPSCRHQLREDTVNHARGANGGAPKVLLDSEGNDAHVAAGVLNDEDLDGKGQDRDEDEHPIVAELGEDVEVALAKLPRVYLVEELEEDERLEDNGVHLHLVGGLALDPGGGGVVVKASSDALVELLSSGVERVAELVLDVEPVSAEEEKQQKPDHLVEGLKQDVSPHDGIHDQVRLLRGHSLQNSLTRRLSGESESGEGVHDQVNPEHLSGGEGRLSEDAGTGEDDEHSDDVDGELELEELAHVVVDVAAVHNGSQDGAEVVIEELDIASALGDVRASDAHGEADIGAVKSGGVVGAIASDGDGLSVADQAVDEHELVVGLGSGHDLDLGSDLLELVHIADDSLDLSLVLLLVAIIRIVFLLLLEHFLDLDATVNGLSELLASHANVFSTLLLGVQVGLSQDASLEGDSSSSVNVVTGDHADVDASLAAGVDGVLDSGSERVLEAEHASDGELALHSGISVLTVPDSGPLVSAHISVADEEGTESSVSVSLLSSQKGLLLFVGDLADFATGSQDAAAVLNNNLGGTLAVDTEAVALGKNNGGALALGVQRDLHLGLERGTVGDLGLHLNARCAQVVEKTKLSNVAAALFLRGGVAIAILFVLIESSGVHNDGVGDVVAARESTKHGRVGALANLSLQVGRHHRHLVLSERASLISANLVGVAHSLRGLQLAHQVVKLLHLFDREGEGDRDGEREAFRDSDHNNGDGNDEAVGNVLPEVDAEVTLGVLHSLDEGRDDDREQSQDGDSQTDLANTLSDAVKLHLERSLLSLDVHGETGAALIGVIANSKHDSLSLTFLDLGALKHKGVTLGVVLVDRLLGEIVRLASEGCLRGEALGGGDDEAVSGDGLAVANDDDVTDDDLLRVDSGKKAAALDVDFLHISLAHEFLELLLFRVVVSNGHNHDNHDSEHDTSSLLEALSNAVLDAAECGGHNGGHDEHLEDEVLEDFADHVADAADFALMSRVFAIDLSASVNVFFAVETRLKKIPNQGEISEGERGRRCLDRH